MYARLSIFIILLFPSAFLFSQQAPSITWQHCYGGTDNDIAYSITATGDGNFVIAGGSASSNGDILGRNMHGGNYDEWIAKIDANASILWKRHTGGPGSDVALKVIQTRDGGYVVGGNSTSFDVANQYSNSDYWVNRLNADGTVAWSKNYGGLEGYDDFGSLDTTMDGGYILCGGSSSTDGDVTGNIGSSDYWVVKTDALGNIQWQKNYGGTDYDKAQAIKQTPDGGYIVIGFTSSSDVDVTGFHGVEDCWLIKLDASGNLQWQHSYGGSLDDFGYDVKVLADGYVFCGETFSNDGDVSGNHGDFDAWVAKVDLTGNILWQHCYGGTATDDALSLDATPDQGFIVGGFSMSNNGDCTSNYGFQDYWLFKIDTGGSLVWQKNYGGTQNEVCNSVIALPGKGYATAGYTASDDMDVTGNHTPYVYKDYWVVMLDISTGIESVNNVSSHVNVFPLPAKDFFNITLEDPFSEKNKSTQVQLLDMTGKIMKVEYFDAGKNLTIDCSQWPDGMYFYSIKHENEIAITGKVMVQR